MNCPDPRFRCHTGRYINKSNWDMEADADTTEGTTMNDIIMIIFEQAKQSHIKEPPVI